MSDASNDDKVPAPGRVRSAGDPHGEAALLLVESLLHELLQGALLTNAQALAVVQSAIDVQCEIDDERGRDPAAASIPVRLLGAIAQSIMTDQRG